MTDKARECLAAQQDALAVARAAGDSEEMLLLLRLASVYAANEGEPLPLGIGDRDEICNHIACDAFSLFGESPTPGSGKAIIADLRRQRDELRHVGCLMSNVLYNLAQRDAIDPRERQQFDALRRAWDAIK